MNYAGHNFKKSLFLWLPNGLGTPKEVTYGPSPIKATMEAMAKGDVLDQYLNEFFASKFGIPDWTPEKERDYRRRSDEANLRLHNQHTGHDHATVQGADLCNMMSD